MLLLFKLKGSETSGVPPKPAKLKGTEEKSSSKQH